MNPQSTIIKLIKWGVVLLVAALLIYALGALGVHVFHHWKEIWHIKG